MNVSVLKGVSFAIIVSIGNVVCGEETMPAPVAAMPFSVGEETAPLFAQYQISEVVTTGDTIEFSMTGTFPNVIPEYLDQFGWVWNERTKNSAMFWKGDWEAKVQNDALVLSASPIVEWTARTQDGFGIDTHSVVARSAVEVMSTLTPSFDENGLTFQTSHTANFEDTNPGWQTLGVAMAGIDRTNSALQKSMINSALPEGEWFSAQGVAPNLTYLGTQDGSMTVNGMELGANFRFSIPKSDLESVLKKHGEWDALSSEEEMARVLVEFFAALPKPVSPD